MPVDVTRVKGKLKELFPQVNLSTKRLDELAARLSNKAADGADDSVIAELINNANDFMPFADIAKEDDRVRTLEANQKKKPDEKKDTETKPDPTKLNTDDEEDMPKWAKSVMEVNKTLLSEIETLKKGNVIESKRTEAKKLFEQNPTLKGLSEKAKEHYLNQLKFDEDTPLADQVTGLDAIHNEIVQTKVDGIQLPGKPPAGGNVAALSVKDMDKIITDARA